MRNFLYDSYEIISKLDIFKSYNSKYIHKGFKMKLLNKLAFIVFSTTLSYSSSLMVYKDKSIYSYEPTTTYIGFAKGIKAKCDGTSVSLQTMLKCDESNALCKESLYIKDMQKKLSTIQYNSETLDTMLTLAKPTKIDANSWIDSAREFSLEKSNLFYEAKSIRSELSLKQNEFKKKVSSLKALQSRVVCKGDFELSLPRNLLSFSIAYKASIEKDQIEVTQYLNIVNRSGIDMEVDSATFYNRLAHQYIRPIHFTPWVASKYIAVDNMMKRQSLSKSKSMLSAMPVRAMVFDEEVQNVATYVDAREYSVKNLKLPSTGVPLEVEVLSWSSEVTCKLKAYPYLSTDAFEVCSFKPKYQIEQNRWRVKSKNQVINENALGEYAGSSYNIYSKKDDDLKIKREKIVDKERETGFFGGTARKKDGFTVTVTNKSTRVKKLTLIERVPIANTDEIEVKLLSVKAKDRVDYRLLKNGKIEINLNLKSNESKKIEILFELVYDKKIKIRY